MMRGRYGATTNDYNHCYCGSTGHAYMHANYVQLSASSYYQISVASTAAHCHVYVCYLLPYYVHESMCAVFLHVHGQRE